MTVLSHDGDAYKMILNGKNSLAYQKWHDSIIVAEIKLNKIKIGVIIADEFVILKKKLGS